VRAQLLIGKHYVDDSVNSLTFLQFNADMTFQYSYAYDLMNDHATGKYALIKDTVLLKYDYVQEPIILDGGLSSHTEYNRADTLLIKKHKLFQIKNGVSMEYAPPIVYDLKKNKRKPPKSWHYKRKYLLFGPYQSQSKNSYYMIDEQYAVWATRKWRKRHPSG
jgi:hypothetical protein